jgi:signal transduction histidine kinase/ActR/RegA family two-component response regulator
MGVLAVFSKRPLSPSDEVLVQAMAGTASEVVLAAQAEERRQELEAQLRQSQKLEAVGQLAGGVAHDFNNILTTIMGNVELGLDRVRRELGPDHSVVRSMESIETAAQRASTLTRQLLTFSRRDVMQPRVLNLNSILANLQSMLSRLITENITLGVVTSPTLKSVRADAGQLEQVIVNLVVNAVHAMPDGGRLTLETQNVSLDEHYVSTHAEARPGPHVLLTVSDTGCGMDVQTCERIFEPFFTTKPVDQGTGLGLATVHGVVRQAGGHIMVDSEPGQGTTFRVYLPADDAAPEHAPSHAPPDAELRGHETLLLCEDDHLVRRLVADALGAAGYTTIIAGSPQETIALSLAHAGPIDLLITDVIMPDMNGRALSEHLRELRPGLPTLFISGYSADVIAPHGVLDEGVQFLEKPFTRRQLLTKIRAVLARANSCPPQQHPAR